MAYSPWKAQRWSLLRGTAYRVIQRWVGLYRQGGLSEVLQRVTGHGTQGQAAYMTVLQQKALVAQVRLGDLPTVGEVLRWVEDRWGIVYSYEGMRSVMKRNRLGLKVARPRSEKARPAGQEQWQKKN